MTNSENFEKFCENDFSLISLFVVLSMDGFLIMEIKKINIAIIQKDTLLGFANIEFEEFFVGSVGIHTDKNGIHLTWPAKKLTNGNLSYFFRPKEQAQEQISKAVEKEIMRLGLYDFSFSEKKVI